MNKFIVNQSCMAGLLVVLVACNGAPTNTSGRDEKKDVFQIGTESCIDSTKINPEGMCAEMYDPVCGCNGENYPNACYAEKAGVTQYIKGECR
jgi:hypothetical protein